MSPRPQVHSPKSVPQRYAPLFGQIYCRGSQAGAANGVACDVLAWGQRAHVFGAMHTAPLTHRCLASEVARLALARGRPVQVRVGGIQGWEVMGPN